MSNNLFTKPASLVIGAVGAAAAVIALAACDPLNEPATEAAKATPTISTSVERAAEADQYDSGESGSSSGSGSGGYFSDKIEPAPTTESESYFGASSLEEVYITVLRDEGFYGYSDEELVDAGNIACRLFDGGATPQGLSLDILLGDVVLLDGATNEQQAYIAGGAVGALCPEHSHLLEGL